MKIKVLLTITLSLMCSFSLYAEASSAPALTRATNEELSSAVGHFARTRSLLIAAIREFDNGLHYANPEQILDVKEFRHTLLDHAEALEKILSPQPRTTKYGVRFNADPRLLSDVVK